MHVILNNLLKFVELGPASSYDNIANIKLKLKNIYLI